MHVYHNLGVKPKKILRDERYDSRVSDCVVIVGQKARACFGAGQAGRPPPRRPVSSEMETQEKLQMARQVLLVIKPYWLEVGFKW